MLKKVRQLNILEMFLPSSKICCIAIAKSREIFSPQKVVVLNNEDARSWRDLFFILSTVVVKVVYTQCLCLLLCSLLKGHRSEEEEESERKKKKAKAAKVFFSSFSPKKWKGSCISASPICLRLLLSNIHPLDYSKWNTISPRASFTDYFHGAFLTKAKSIEAFACGTMDHHWLLPWLTVFLSTTLDVLASLLQSCFINRKCQICIYLA